MRLPILAWLLIVLSFPALPASAEPLEILITPRPPYYVLDDQGAVGGIVADRARQAFAKAGLEVTWTVVSFNRQLQLIEDNRSPLCGIGWFKKPEREQFAKFTEHIYQDRALIALSRTRNPAVTGHRDLRALMGDRSLIMGKKLGFSYGAAVDDLIIALEPRSITTDQDNAGMARMLIGRRFDYMILAPEEAEHLLGALGASGQKVTTVELLDLSPQNKRYIMCSQSVRDDIIDALNGAIPDRP